MKSIVVYESHYGHTAYVADRFLEALKEKGEAEIFELVQDTETKAMPTNVEEKVKPTGVSLEHAPSDIRKYDCLCLCIPIWHKHLDSPLSKYIDKCINIDAKNIICCQIYGDKKNNKICFEYTKKTLERKGRPKIIGVFINWRDIHNERFLNKVIKKAVNKVA
jgi:menaquinone-dependent protoporphyrinogen IX oxidase